MEHWNCQSSPQDFGETISLTWIAKNQHGVNNFDGFSSFSCVMFMLPIEHGKQNHDENSVKTLEVSSANIAERHLNRFNVIFIMILLPMLHGKHEKGTWKWRKTIRIVNAVLILCNSGQRNCLSEIWRWKLAVSVLHFLLYVCSETQICKMSPKVCRTAYWKLCVSLGTYSKTWKMRKIKLENNLW